MPTARLLRLIGPCALAAMLAGCGDISPTEPASTFVETHRAILDGSVVGAVGQPLEDVEVIVDFGNESTLARPVTTTDGAGQFLFVLAIYDAPDIGADSVTATVYAIARDARGGGRAIAHKVALIHFLPLAQEPPRTTIRFKLDAL